MKTDSFYEFSGPRKNKDTARLKPQLKVWMDRLNASGYTHGNRIRRANREDVEPGPGPGNRHSIKLTIRDLETINVVDTGRITLKTSMAG